LVQISANDDDDG